MTIKKGYIAQQAKRLSDGEINRRRFVMSALSVGVTMPTAMSLASRAEALTPRRGGQLRIATGSGSACDALTPALSRNAFTRTAISMLGNQLTEVTDAGEVVGALAENYEVSADAKTWIFNLRADVEFHNGKSLTPDDVVATFDLHRANPASRAHRALNVISDVRVTERRQITFTLRRACPEFGHIVSDSNLMILPSEHGYIEDAAAGIGTGAYRLVQFNPGEDVFFRRDPNFWKENVAHFDEIQLLSITDASARVNALINGNVHYADRIDPRMLALIHREPELEVFETKGTRHHTFSMRMDAAPFSNHNLRQALKFAIKRQELVDNVLLGHGRVGNDIVEPTPNGLPVHEFNADKAAYYYSQSGHDGPIELATSEAAFAGAVDAARLIAASAKEAGIDVHVREVNVDEYWTDVWGKSPWYASTSAGRPVSSWMVEDACTAMGWRGSIPDAKQFQAQSGAIVALWANDIAAHTRSLVHAPDFSANGPSQANQITEHWWFA